MIRLFVETAPSRVAAIKAAVDRGDTDDVGEEAHALKGAGSTFGAVRLTAVCSTLERVGRDGDLEQARGLIGELEEASAVTQVALEEQLGRLANR